jgi:hypothetical protein
MELLRHSVCLFRDAVRLESEWNSALLDAATVGGEHGRSRGLLNPFPKGLRQENGSAKLEEKKAKRAGNGVLSWKHNRTKQRPEGGPEKPLKEASVP